MAGGREDHGGGIVGLLDLIEEHGTALEYDLIALGLRLRYCPSEGFDWRDLKVVVSQADDKTKLWQSQNPKFAGWTVTDRLLAIIANGIRWLVWAKTKDGSKNRNRPKPIGPDMAEDKKVRPGLKVKAGALSKVKQMLGLSGGAFKIGGGD